MNKKTLSNLEQLTKQVFTVANYVRKLSNLTMQCCANEVCLWKTVEIAR